MQDDIDLYLSRKEAQGLAPASIRIYRVRLQELDTFLRSRGCLEPADVNIDDLIAYMLHLYDLNRAHSSRSLTAATICRFFRWLQEEGRIEQNPAHDLPVPNDGEPDLLPPPLSVTEVQALFDALPKDTVIDLRNRCLLELLYGCGLRRSEAVFLNLDDIDIESARPTLHVRHGKGCQERLLPVMPTALAALQDYTALRRSLLRGPDHGALLLTREGKRMRHHSVSQWFADLNAARGPQARHLHAHLFRHSIAVHLLQGGADLRHIQQFLGHSDLDTTKIYLRLVPGRLKDDYDAAMPEIEVGMSQPAVKPTSE